MLLLIIINSFGFSTAYHTDGDYFGKIRVFKVVQKLFVQLRILYVPVSPSCT